MKKDSVDRLNIKSGIQTEEFKRPDHPDFQTGSELAAKKFSGYRMNSLTDAAEIWLEGVVKAIITKDDLDKDGQAVNKAMSEVFMLDRILPDTPEARLLGRFNDDEANRKSDIVIVQSIN